MESSQQSAKSRLSLNQHIDISKDKESNKVTYINYYISPSSKENKQSCHSKFFKFIRKQAVNIFYGILGSIVASALSGAIYSIVNSASDQDEVMVGNNSTTTAMINIESNWISFNGN